MCVDRDNKIRALLDEYIEMYSSRDDRLTARFSQDFSGYTGGGNFLVKDRDEWVSITRLDFSQVPKRIRIEMLDTSIQDISDDVVVASAFFHIHLPVPDHVLSQEVARLVLIFRQEDAGWKIVHSGISIPYHGVGDGEVYPLRNLQERNIALGALVEERTRALNESQALYRLLTEDALDVIWRTDGNLRITYISPADERLRGFKAEEMVGRHIFDMFAPEGIALVKKLLRQRQITEGPVTRSDCFTFELQHRCKDGRLLWGEIRAKPEFNGAGEIVGYHGITRDITERKLLQDQVHQLAFHDPLTSLPNRRLMQDRLSQAMAASRRSACHNAFMFLDLDGFKTLNDTHGHKAGDLLLQEVAGRLKHCTREVDTVSRLGGDEFVVMLTGLDVDKDAAQSSTQLVAEKILAALAAPYVLPLQREGQTECPIAYCCSVSIGVVMFVAQESTQDDILKWADHAMYQAKEAGGNAIRFHAAVGCS